MKRDEEIVNIAKQKEESQVFCDLVKSPISQGVNSAYGVGFIEGAKWADEHISAETFRRCIYMLNNTCYENGTGVDESDIEYAIKQNNLL